jgi:rhodanese-related sulfurtransferase
MELIMNTNDFTMYLAIIAVAVLLINNIYQRISMLRAKAQGAFYHKLDQDEAKTYMDKDKSIVVLDVRTPNEYKNGHIKRAKNLSSVKEIASKYPNKDTVFYVYCQSGSRSLKAAKKLVMKGYKEVYDIGGLSYWNYGTTKK